MSAKTLLSRLTASEINGFTEEAFLHAAGLWLDLGDADMARTLLNPILTWSDTVWSRVRASAVVDRFDAAEAPRMVERAYATIGPSGPGLGAISQFLREADLEAVAVHLSRYDPRRAVAVAREMTTVDWSHAGHDRYSALARIAHRRLDAGDVGTGESILAEILRSTELPPPLVDQRRPGPYRPISGSHRAEGPRTPRDRAEHLVFVHNHSGYWRVMREQRFYRDPADLMRAAPPGPGMVGNPHCLARTVRVLAESVAGHDLPAAAALVRALTDHGERAIGMAGLLPWAARGTTLAEQLRVEFEQALSGIAPFEWAADDQDSYAFAYLRPDHRARFEAAIRLIPFDPETGKRLMRESGASYLDYAWNMSFMVYASREIRPGRGARQAGQSRGRDVQAGTRDDAHQTARDNQRGPDAGHRSRDDRVSRVPRRAVAAPGRRGDGQRPGVCGACRLGRIGRRELDQRRFRSARW